VEYFMSEEEAIAIIDANMDQIEARMASGTNASSSQANASNSSGTFSEPCNGDCQDTGTPEEPAILCCNCCVC